MEDILKLEDAIAPSDSSVLEQHRPNTVLEKLEPKLMSTSHDDNKKQISHSVGRYGGGLFT